MYLKNFKYIVNLKKILILIPIYTIFTWMGPVLQAVPLTLTFHFLPPTIPWPEAPDKVDDVLPPALPKTLRSSNNLYEGIKGFGAAAGAGFLGPVLTRGSPCIADPLIPLAGKELWCCKGLVSCMGM